ncbi:MAG: glycoside hydrolase family 2 protein [Chitinophagaceae bacterium]|nr:glycoside hydrolase family 2 protein [Chitinophagaceae bacterium]
MKKITVLLSFILAVVFAEAQLNWPTVTNVTKPWTRWWWEGSAVNKNDLTWNLEQYRKAGLGGVELTPIYGVYGYEKEFINFLSPQWMQMFTHTLNESKRLGLGVDLANGTGWPFGGPWVKNEDASKTIFYKTYSLNEGEQLKDAIEYNQEAWVRTANNKPAAIENILKPVYVNKNLQELALDQIQYAGKLPLQTLIAYSDKNETINLTDKVDATGKLNWSAPPTGGKWTLYALFQGLHGKMVERAAPGGEGYAIDHFSLTAANNYFKKFDASFKGYDISYLRSFFNDSYEVDDARGQGNWTTNLFTEFQQRKGYDLRNHLPALFGKDETEKNKRVIYDYRSVIDELLLEHFTMTWKKWAGTKGKMLRNQSHGSPANTLDLYSVVDIPETEGTDILRFKFATSAANVMGKQLVSSESATWLNEHFLSSWGDVKKAIDLYFLGGVNHIFYHGTEYSPKEAKWPGWLFYAAVHFQPTNPQWKDFHVLNEYITRTQSFLQKGKPDNDVLLYYPIVDRYSEPGNALLQHFDGMERNFEKTEFEHVSKWMVEKGYSFDFFSERQLQRFTNRGNNIISSGNAYRTILLPANKLINEQSFQQLLKLAKQGATILVYKNLPQDVPGFGNLDARRKTFQQLISQLKFSKSDNLQKAVVGKGSFIMSDDLDVLLLAAKARKESYTEKGLSVLRRKNNEGTVWLINNRTDNALEEWIEINSSAVSFGLFDAMTGKKGLAKWRKNTKGGVEVLLQLQSYESIIIQSYNVKKSGTVFPYKEAAGQPQEIKSNWTITFLDGGPTIPSSIKTDQLISWTELGGDDVKNFSGTGKYSVEFEKSAGSTSSYLLNLGKVNETAEVFLNGKRITTLIGPVFQCVIPASAFQQTNKLEIIVANLMANRISYMDRNNLPWKIFYNTNMPARKRENVKNGLFDASVWKPLSSGLLGPVTITPLK